ncbi:hypothetical protein Dimus_027113 [Dionaea muscipula]
MVEFVQEIAIYIHRFHNLDLFQQGWYQIKITMKWEDSAYASVGFPSRVLQYEAPNPSSDEIFGVWRIDDSDNSFATQPFKIRYARQDVPLSVMIAFNLSLKRHEVPPKSAVILKFELMYAPLLEKGSVLQVSPTSSAASIHEFRIPPKALLGLHSYCPVHFDAFHAVLVDLSVHISLLKSSVRNARQKVASDLHDEDYAAGRASNELSNGFSQEASVIPNEAMRVKALLTSRDILLEEMQKLGKAIDQVIDFTEFISQLDDAKLFSLSLRPHLPSTNFEVPGRDSGEAQNKFEKPNVFLDFRSNGLLHSVPYHVLLHAADTIGNQIVYLWTVFLNFHRANKSKILEYLRDTWANDRRAEWSIWMVYSKVEMPHHYINSRAEESSYHGGMRTKVSVLRKLTDDPAQTASIRAELHRRSIAQMRINSHSIQDMQIFEDPSRVPVVIVERVVNAPRRTYSGNSYFCHHDQELQPSLNGLKNTSKFSTNDQQQNGRLLKIVVFVHGFQGHHLDLRLVRNQWLLIDPKTEFLMSEVNEDKTSGDFREMGSRLAEEVASFVQKKKEKASRSGSLRSIKLSFVGHSIGNVIIRTALAESIMEPYLRYLHTYVSVSGPHLGYLYSSNSLFNSGLWILKKFKNTRCIHQLTFTDDPDLYNTFFYKLCQQKTLDNFKNIILLSSPQDGYVPYHSARIELCQASSSDFSKKGKVFLDMLNNCLDQIRSPSVVEQRVFMRCDVNFNMSSHGRNLNTFIGRAAHIEFLETDIFAKFIMWSFPELFH